MKLVDLARGKSEKNMKSVARLVTLVLFLLIILSVYVMVLSFAGYKVFTLSINGVTYTDAVFAGESYGNWWDNGLSGLVVIGTGSNIYVIAHEYLEITTHIGLSLIHAVEAIPTIISLYFLMKVFYNFSKGIIFKIQNANYLFLSGIILFLIAIISPIFILLIGFVINLIGNNIFHVSTGQNMINTVFYSGLCIIASHIISSGCKDKKICQANLL